MVPGYCVANVAPGRVGKNGVCRGENPLAGGLGVSPRPVLSLSKDTFLLFPLPGRKAEGSGLSDGARGMVELVLSSRHSMVLE